LKEKGDKKESRKKGTSGFCGKRFPHREKGELKKGNYKVWGKKKKGKGEHHWRPRVYDMGNGRGTQIMKNLFWKNTNQKPGKDRGEERCTQARRGGYQKGKWAQGEGNGRENGQPVRKEKRNLTKTKKKKKKKKLPTIIEENMQKLNLGFKQEIAE